MPTNSGIRTMRSHVSRFGMLKGMRPALVELIVNSHCELAADAFDLRKFIDARGHQTLEPAESREQALPPFCADAGDALERRSIARLAPSCAMALDGEAMRLVANLL